MKVYYTYIANLGFVDSQIQAKSSRIPNPGISEPGRHKSGNFVFFCFFLTYACPKMFFAKVTY